MHTLSTVFYLSNEITHKLQPAGVGDWMQSAATDAIAMAIGDR